MWVYVLSLPCANTFSQSQTPFSFPLYAHGEDWGTKKRKKKKQSEPAAVGHWGARVVIVNKEQKVSGKLEQKKSWMLILTKNETWVVL